MTSKGGSASDGELSVGSGPEVSSCLGDAATSSSETSSMEELSVGSDPEVSSCLGDTATSSSETSSMEELSIGCLGDTATSSSETSTMGSAPLSAASGGTRSLSAACTPLDSVDARRAHYLLERFAELPLQGEDAVLEPETHVAQPQRRALRFTELRREVSVGGGLGDVAEDEALPVDAHQDAAGACLSRDGGVVASLRRGLDGIRFHWSRQGGAAETESLVSLCGRIVGESEPGGEVVHRHEQAGDDAHSHEQRDQEHAGDQTRPSSPEPRTKGGLKWKCNSNSRSEERGSGTASPPQ